MFFDLKKDIYVNMFVDEKKKVNNRWNYIGMLIVKEEFEEEIISFFKRTQEEEKVKEMKYENVKINGGKYNVAMKWLDFLCDGFLSHPECKFFVNILGIDMEKLDYSCFGAKKEMEKYYRSYGRFFRTIIKSSWSHFFKNKDFNYVIRKVFHDTEGVLENEQPYFKRQLKKAFEEDESLQIEDMEIKFVNSNPSKEKVYKEYSYLIEFIDLVLGVVSFAFDDEKAKAKKLQARKKMVLKIDDILQQITYNKASYYKAYLKNFDISFFPKNTYNENIPIESLFYKRKPRIFGQQKLF
ncbi:MAG: hypothetical protein PWP54_1030 [Thermosipho sp. (in: thermotogales)]|nr:hypothetical protein [Thermosipho sp. (in: thermotogales)]MDN5325109.1 hypothetical protein [Thermosipho sp. (in: thermotogales)]